MKADLIHVINMLQTLNGNRRIIRQEALAELSLRELTHISQTLTAEIKMGVK